MKSITHLNVALFKKAQEISPFGIIIFNKNNDIIFANKKTIQLLGYNNKEITTIKINSVLNSKTKKNKTTYIKNKEGKSISIIITTNKILEKKSGLFIIYFNKFSEQEKSNLNKENIIERKLLLNKINSLKKEFDGLINQTILRSKNIALVAHDLKSPLGVISTSLSLLRQHTEKHNIKEIPKHISRIENKVLEINESITNLIAKDIRDEELSNNNIEKVNIKNYLRELKNNHTPILKKGQIITYSNSGTDIIQINKNIINTILSNLISNASKYSNENTPIQIKTKALKNVITFEVKDKGIGIPANEQKNIFNKYYRCQNTKNLNGNGLGLHIIKSKVKNLNGKIYVSSNLGKGTTFRIEIPQKHNYLK